MQFQFQSQPTGYHRCTSTAAGPNGKISRPARRAPPCPSRSLVAVDTEPSTLPALHRNVTTPKTSSPLRLVFFFWSSSSSDCCCAHPIARWRLQDEAPLQLPTTAASPPASDRPPGLPLLRAPVLIQLPVLLSSRTPSAGNLGAAGWSHALLCQIRGRKYGVHALLRCSLASYCCFAIAMRYYCDTTARIAGFSLRRPM